ncbi:MAG: hypothetical protein GY850_20380 [bacterium]|nr:hypothetical protein [bacterium]
MCYKSMGSMGGAELSSRWDIKELMDSKPLPDTIVAPIDGAESVPISRRLLKI